MIRYLLLPLLLAACASPPERRSWSDIDLGRPVAPAVAAPRGLAPLDPATATAVLAATEAPPRPGVYGAPAGGRTIATFAGPSSPLPARSLSLPLPLWLPALDPADAAAIRDGNLSPALAIDGVGEADVDGDGTDELLVLARPLALFEREGPRRYAVLLVLAPAPGGHRLLSFARFSPSRHAVGGGTPRWCHAEYRLAGFLRGTGRGLPLVWQERGEGCAQLVGGGFDRALHVVDPAHGSTQAIVVAGGRLGAGGAVDLYDGAAWAADADGDGEEELVVRGIASASRPCAGGEAAWWIEELAARVVEPAGIRAQRDGRALPLPDGELPPSLQLRHVAACGAPPSLQ